MLPVEKYKNEIQCRLKTSGTLVFTAPPGSGKSTMLPQFISQMDECKEEVVVLQPRRIAARMLAHSVAKMNHFNLGDEVGFQVRGEKKRGPKTKVSYRTDGLFLRQLISRSELNKVSAVILDEFHERNWQTDVILPLLLEYQKEREDFYIVIMSATMETEKLCHYTRAEFLNCEAELYPVEIYYRQFSRNTPLWERAAKALNDHLLKGTSSGNILVFMPGVYEINKTMDLCRGFKEIEACVLHGSMSPQQQDKSLSSSEKRKIIICTNIAETSLTVEGVDTVIDAGYAKVSKFDSGRGVDSLNLESVSVFSADQRAGRAGRLGPGVCYRLWSDEEHSRKELSMIPEVFRIDLSEVVLQIAKAGFDAFDFNWYERPDEKLIHTALKQLNSLGALRSNKLTPCGDKMSSFPAHPRIARFLIEANQNNCFLEACFWAAILSERSPVDNKTKLEDRQSPASDLGAITDICHSYFNAQGNTRESTGRKFEIKGNVLRSINTAMQQFTRLLRPEAENIHELRRNLVKSLLTAYGDRIGVRVDRGTLRYRFASGRVAELSRSSSVRDSEYIIAIDTIELNSGGNSRLLIGLAVEVTYEMLEETFLDSFEFRNEVSWNETSRCAEEAELILLDGLIIKKQVINNSTISTGMSELLSQKVIDGSLKLNKWNSEVDKWIKKVHWVSSVFPEKELVEYSDEKVKEIVESFCAGCKSFKEIKGVEVLDYFKNSLSWEDQQFVIDMTPQRIELSNGKKIKVKYEEGKAPKISGFIQDFYGVQSTPTLAGGRVKVLVEMLAPSRRPVHVTDDLDGFWDGVYKDIKTQLAGRYPKHKWI